MLKEEHGLSILATKSTDIASQIMSYGMPAIGIICTEFLRQVKNPNEVEAKLPRSETVQNLSMMIGFLDWVQPAAGNYKLCHRMCRVIRRVLDKVLDPEPERDFPDAGVGPEATQAFWPGTELDDLDWLSSTDWTRGGSVDVDWLNIASWSQDQVGDIP